MTLYSRWPWFLVLPGLVFLTIAFILPIAVLFANSLFDGSSLSLVNYLNFVQDPVSQRAYLRTVKIAVIVTLLAMTFCYPAAYAVSRLSSKWRILLIALIILPLMTNSVARTFSWMVILGRQGLINNTLQLIGLEPLRILYTENAVFIGLLHLFIPLMMLPLISAFENIPEDVELAARNLGASEWQIFLKVFMPLTAEGLAIGGTLVFTGCVTAYVTPAILGGSRHLMLSTLLYQKASVTLDWVGATVVAVVMFVTTLIVIYFIRLISGTQRSKPSGGT